MSQNPVSGGLRITRFANPWALGKQTLANGWEGKWLVQAFWWSILSKDMHWLMMFWASTCAAIFWKKHESGSGTCQCPRLQRCAVWSFFAMAQKSFDDFLSWKMVMATMITCSSLLCRNPVCVMELFIFLGVPCMGVTVEGGLKHLLGW